MAISLHDINYDPVQHQLPPRRYAWSVFAIVFALMVVDYVDRQVVVSMFPHLKAQWDLSDRQLGALVSIVSVTVALGTVPLCPKSSSNCFATSPNIVMFAYALVRNVTSIARDPCAHCAPAGGANSMTMPRLAICHRPSTLRSVSS